MLSDTQITSLTHRFILPKVVDGVYNSAAFLAYMMQPGKYKKIDGGRNLNFPVISSEPDKGGSFSDLDTLDTNRTDNITAAQFEWKQYYEPIRVSRREILQNSGKAQVVNLLTAKGKIAQKQIRENLADGLFSDGTGNSSKDITGFQALFNQTSSTSYGNIAEDDMATWVAQYKGNSGSNRALTLALMQTADGSATEGDDKPDVITCKQDMYDEAWGLFQPHQRLMSEKMSKLGFENVISFNGKPLIVDSHMKANSMYFINSEYAFLAIHPKENLRYETIEKLETTNSLLSRIFWMGNLCCNNRRFHAELADISVAS